MGNTDITLINISTGGKAANGSFWVICDDSPWGPGAIRRIGTNGDIPANGTQMRIRNGKTGMTLGTYTVCDKPAENVRVTTWDVMSAGIKPERAAKPAPAVTPAPVVPARTMQLRDVQDIPGAIARGAILLSR